MSISKIIGAAALLTAGAGIGWMQAQSVKTNKLTADDYMEIQALYYNYAHSIDAGQGDRFAALWTEDGEFTHGYGPGQANADRTPAKGTAALNRVGATSGTRHFVTNIVVTPTPDGNAKASCYLLLYSARTVPPSFTETAIYDDNLVRTPQGWKFKKRIVWRDDDDITPFKPKPLPAGRGGGRAPAQGQPQAQAQQ